MTFEEMLQQTVNILQSRGRVSYRALQRQFEIDDAYLQDLKDELLYAYPQVVDEHGRGLAWIAEQVAESTAPAAGHASVREPHTYTPPHLAEKILTSHAALQGERKQVTVFFCDLTNSTGLAERLGPERMHRVLNQFFELALHAVHRYEGTINQFLGDGFMALFGAPIAHEDHARRAVLAAQDLRRELHVYNTRQDRTEDDEISIRIGINTGMVVVGAIGDNLRMDYTAVGDTTNIAARLEQAAASDQIVISETTHRLMEGYCTTRDLGELSLKGKVESIHAWEVVVAQETRTRLEVEMARGLTPFISRQRELHMLTDHFAEAQQGHGQIVFLVGEAGLGKSRLLLEFRRQLGAEVTWFEGHALSFGQSMTFYPVIDLLKRNLRIEENDSEDTIIEKITQGVLHLGEDLQPILPYVRYLLAVDPGDAAVRTMEPQLRRAELFAALRRLLLQAAEVRPQVLVFEDLHWMDNATGEFLISIADSIPASRVLCLLTYRPGYVHPFGDRTYHTRIALQPLSTADTVQMTQAMLVTEHLPAELVALIAQKAEGNPFFTEEVVRSLREIGALRREGDVYILDRPLDEMMVPDTIQDVLMARIDRLEETQKQTLQLASVIGREFTYRLLSRLPDLEERTDASLQALKASELVYETAHFPELVYMFKHALAQDVAYNSLLVQQRQELHHRVGQTIEALYVDRLAEHYEVLAYHFARAEQWSKALDYLCKAAEKAAETFATHEALSFYDQAEAAANQLHDTPIEMLIRIHRARANLYLLVSDFTRARTEWEYVLPLARQLDDQLMEGIALAGMGQASFWGHQFDQALIDARQAMGIAEAIDAQAVLAGSHLTNGLVYEMTGRLREASDELDQVLTISRSVGDVTNEATALVFAAELKGWEGLFADAVQLYTKGIQLAQAHNVLMPVLEGLFMRGIALTSQGDYDAALASFEEGLGLAAKVGDENFAPRYVNSLGWLHIECGSFERALALNQRASAAGQDRGDHEAIANAELNLGDIFLTQGDLRLARETLDGVHHLVHDAATSEWMRWRYSMHLFASLGELWLASGDLAKAQASANQCLDIATRTHSQKYIVKSWRLKGEIALARRQWDEGERWLRQALQLAHEVGNPTQLWKTHLALGNLYAETKQPDMARHAYQAARQVIDRTKTNLQNLALRTSLENSPLIQNVYDLSA